jgi:hypothetical protein
MLDSTYCDMSAYLFFANLNASPSSEHLGLN